jgi:hypothetical protein
MSDNWAKLSCFRWVVSIWTGSDSFIRYRNWPAVFRQAR